MTYYIYHIEGVKIGCTTQPNKRVKYEQKYSNWEILEEHSDIYIASDREQELQKQYGYKVDKNPYYKSYKVRQIGKTTKTCSKGGKIGGKITGKQKLLNGEMEKMRKLAAEKKSIPILVYDLMGNFIGNYKSRAEAARELNLDFGAIRCVLRGITKKHKGYTFKYA